MYSIRYKITIGKYALRLVDSVTITKSVENLADTAVIVAPGAYINKSLQLEGKVKEGDPVEIRLGYDDDNPPLEFKGYLSSIATDDSAVRLECEDALYLFKKPLKDVEHKNIGVKALLQKLVDEVNAANKKDGAATGYTVKCDYEFTWEKFVLYRATAFDVLKKVQDETKANIYFSGDVLHVHPQYSEPAGSGKPVVYDVARNIEKSSLKYVPLKNKKIEVEVTATLPDGKQKKVSYGVTGGTKKAVALGSADEASMKSRAEQEYNLFAYDGYEGSFTGWLVPYVEPGYRATLRDRDYPEKEGTYYVVAVETKLSSAGGERTVTVGKKVG
jgi:hypothetical protein